MGSGGLASYGSGSKAPSARSLATPFVLAFRDALSASFQAMVPGYQRTIGQSIGVYAFHDYDGEPIYVGQTNEGFSTRVGRHLTGQRSDTLAYRILDPFEVASVRYWPAESHRQESKQIRIEFLNSLEFSVYQQAIADSKYGAILNEKLPPKAERIELDAPISFELVSGEFRRERSHPDVRIARRAETLARLAAVAHERGVVSAGLRRVIVVQAMRLADLSAARLAFAEGRQRADAAHFDLSTVVGSIGFDWGDGDSDSLNLFHALGEE